MNAKAKRERWTLRQYWNAMREPDEDPRIDRYAIGSYALLRERM
jgi:hypothetical protein